MEPLTARQAEVLAELRRYSAEHGWMPSLQELATTFGLRATSTIHKHLDALRAKGYIERRWNHVRATKIVPPTPTAEQVARIIDDIVSCADEADGGKVDARALCERLVAILTGQDVVP